ncbi:hypothetical protein Glove_264g47 [Diversispora epigaea]|uniref:Uncharacterized protein n=1 Tax=Diversispora epigaea TaxID=1348612 RepID=A0A397I5G7_9GLOM|nr:hypothetical protein Glove_264g47 [Diversispora epigaea]
MLEQEYEIFSPLPSIFAEEYDSNGELEQEEFSLEYNEILDNSSTNNMYSKKTEDNETFEKEEIIEHLENTELISCVVIDFVKGKIQRCGDSTKLRPLHNLFGTWQVDRDAIKEVDGVLSRLRVCSSYFQFDNKYLHNSQNKQLKDFSQGIIQWPLQVCPPLCKRAFDITKPQCICCLCYEDMGGHIYNRPGRGKKATTCITKNSHKDDVTKGLELLGNWLVSIARTRGHDQIKKELLIKTFDTFLPFINKFISIVSSQVDSTNVLTNLEEISLHEPPSLFMMNMEFGREFGRKLWNLRSDINSKKSALECPKTIQEYYNGFPKFLNNFFSGIINELYCKKMIISNLGRIPRLLGFFRRFLTVCHVTSHSDRHERKLAKVRMEKSNLTRCLIQGNNVWNLATIDNIDFKEKSFKYGNIYDVTRDNSHVTLRMAFQAQLPIEIETVPEEVVELTTETPLFGLNQDINDTLSIFQQVIYELLDFKKIDEELVYKTDFDAKTIKQIILTRLDRGSLGLSPNVVILEPGANPNSDEEILRVAEMYKKDFSLKIRSFLDIVADEVIFRHYGLLSLTSHLGVRFLDKFESVVDYRSTARVLDLLWAAVGIAINIYTTEKKISLDEIMDGVRFLDKFESVVDYRSTARVLDLLWAAVGIAINIYTTEKKISLDEIMDAGPLYASAGKLNYTTAIAHYLSIIAAHPKLEEKLRYCSAFKIPNNVNDPNNARHVCFGFDEALETFSVKFIKQNISGNIFDEKNLRDQIKASQDERERIDLLMKSILYMEVKKVPSYVYL